MKNKWKIFQDFSFPQLTSLSVLKNSCSDDFFLPHLSNLKKLTLELDTNDGDLCKLIFDEIYSKAPALEKLELPYCQISKKAIENLKLSYCQIPKTDAVFLNILKNKNVLKNVKIYENEHGLNLLAEKEFEIQDGDEEFYY